MFRPRIDNIVYKTNDKKERESRLSRCVNIAHEIAMDLWGVFRVYENVGHIVHFGFGSFCISLIALFGRLCCYYVRIAYDNIIFFSIHFSLFELVPILLTL